MSELKKTFEEKLKELSSPTDIKDIDFRVQSVNNGGYAVILAYKDARYDMRKLDEIVGPLNWQRKHVSIDGRLYCCIGVYNPETNEWVWKMDVGTESFTEAEKGQASDSFKRAGFNWGIGRDLYDFPLITIKLKEDEITTKIVKGQEKKTANWKFRPNEFTWGITRNEDGTIKILGCRDKNGNVRFAYKEEEKQPKKEE